uniref:Uncharacterized protein n=1 Tax=Bionectria ochroleuca TaxID=29856 RepID=A0A0B7KL66_BIOOC
MVTSYNTFLIVENTNVLVDARDAISDYDNATTEYSATSSLATESMEHPFAAALYKSIEDAGLDQENFERISALLPDLLKTFSIRIGFEKASQMNLDVMYYVRRYRRSATYPDQERLFNGPELEDFEDTSIPVIKLPQESEDIRTPRGPDDPKLQQYQKFAIKTEAYQWLVSRLRLELRLGLAKSTTVQDIRDVIKAPLKDSRKVSRKVPSTSHKVIFKFAWDLSNFLLDQQSILDKAEAFGRVIMLTGFRQDAQALTCEQYLTQTWPTTGKQMSECIRDALRRSPQDPQQQSCFFSDGTKISILFLESEVTVEVTGTSASIIEVGEQLAWLASALRASQHPRRLEYCTPVIKIIDSPSQVINFQIDFVFEDIHNTGLPPLPSNGQC